MWGRLSERHLPPSPGAPGRSHQPRPAHPRLGLHHPRLGLGAWEPSLPCFLFGVLFPSLSFGRSPASSLLEGGGAGGGLFMPWPGCLETPCGEGPGVWSLADLGLNSGSDTRCCVTLGKWLHLSELLISSPVKVSGFIPQRMLEADRGAGMREDSGCAPPGPTGIPLGEGLGRGRGAGLPQELPTQTPPGKLKRASVWSGVGGWG